ncbi:hypothetical protein R6Q57_015562 [Mikania cordata]
MLLIGEGLADLEAAVCLCTAIKANVLGVLKVKLLVALSLVVNSCGKKVPEECAIMSTMSIYDEKKEEDGFLYVTYSGENTFGFVQ